MSFLYQWVVSHTTLKVLQREYPQCRVKQIVAPKQIHQTVDCKECGAPIPPKQKSP